LTLTELQTHYARLYKMITKERRAPQAPGQSVLANSPLLKEKLDECDQALAAATAMKDALKQTIAPAVQETLFDVPESKKIGGY
jgi:hypothetical protein